MTEQERAKSVVTNEDVITGVSQGFQGTVQADHIEQKIENVSEIIGATMEGEDLNDLVTRVKAQINRTKIAAITVWVLCAILFVARFVLN